MRGRLGRGEQGRAKARGLCRDSWEPDSGNGDSLLLRKFRLLPPLRIWASLNLAATEPAPFPISPVQPPADAG